MLSIASVRALALDDTDVDTVQEIAISLVNEDGQSAASYPIPAGSNTVKDVLFKPTINDRLLDYRRAVLEISDPSRNLIYKMPFEGQVPPIIHWDGFFTDNESVETDQRYFVRLLLVYPDKQILSSPWAFFSTRLRTVYDDARKVKGNYVSLYIIPTGALHTLILSTPNTQSAIFPNVYGDVSLVWKEKHSLTLKLEATSNIIFNYNTQRDGVFYSDISLYYRYRLAGGPLRAPVLPASPPFGNYKFRVPNGRPEVWGRPFNAQVGGRIFYTTIRGPGNQLKVPGATIDEELARRFQGLSLVADCDHLWGEFRFHIGGEVGYTVFQGNLWIFGADAAITYDRFEIVSPGLQLRYTLYDGKPSHDGFDGTIGGASSVSNHVVLAGVVLNFKL